ncbi:MAG: hypothetical protein COA79_15575 [Planctomycetota bacterium]|nr:MAG: hypothetical protein COA79_15575 [Planctomycetota bacterium]
MKKKLLMVMLSLIFMTTLHAENKKDESSKIKYVVKGPLETLAKEPGPHIKKIEALADETWLNLGKPGADPKWGTARGRAWTPKMVYSEKVKAVILCATGVHGFVKPDGHYMDDLWAYDVQGHKWICLYPGANAKTLKLKLDKNNFEVNAKGESIPVSYLSHGYHNLTFNPDLNKYMIIYTACPWWKKVIPQRAKWLGMKPGEKSGITKAGKLNMNTKHPIFYDMNTGKWERRFVAGKGPGPRRFSGILEYIPSLKKTFYLYKSGVWFYEYKNSSWEKVEAKGLPKHMAKGDSISCFDPFKKLIYVLRGPELWSYSIQAKSWTQHKGKNAPATIGSARYGAGNSASVTFDTQNKVLVVCLKSYFRDNKEKKDPLGIHVYDPETNVWSKNVVPLPPKTKALNNPRWTACYLPDLNVHLYHAANDSRDNGQMFVWRYKKKSK